MLIEIAIIAATIIAIKFFLIPDKVECPDINSFQVKYDSLETVKNKAIYKIDSLSKELHLSDSILTIKKEERVRIIKIKDETIRIVRNYNLTQRDSFMSTIRIR